MVFRSVDGRLSKPSGVKRKTSTTFTTNSAASAKTFLDSFIPQASLPGISTPWLLPDRDVLPALIGERLTFPSRPALAEHQACHFCHEVELGRPDVAERYRLQVDRAVDGSEVEARDLGSLGRQVHDRVSWRS